MLLMHPADVATAIQATPIGGATTPESKTLVSVLTLLVPRIVSAIDVDSIDLGDYTDCFFLNSRYPSPRFHELRLANAYLKEGSVSVTDPRGDVVNPANYHVDFILGVVKMFDQTQRGQYRVHYTSGFDVEEPDANGYVVYKDVPTSIKALVSEFVIQWYRGNTINPKVPKEMDLGHMNRLIDQQIRASRNTLPTRPRGAVIWSEMTLKQ